MNLSLAIAGVDGCPAGWYAVHLPAGGSDISMFKRLPVAPELQALIDDRASDEAGAPITRPPQQP